MNFTIYIYFIQIFQTKIIYIIIQSLKIEINIFIHDKHIYMFFM